MQLLFCFVMVSLGICTAVPQLLLGANLEEGSPNQLDQGSSLRMEVQSLPRGAELLTLFARSRKEQNAEQNDEFPLLSILRDTLSSSDSDVHRLRQIWLYPHSQPSLGQRVASAIPFFYFGFHRENTYCGKVPPPLLDLAKPMPSLWRRVLVSGIQRTLFDPQTFYIRSSTRTMQQNLGSYRNGQLVRASSVLSLYEKENSAELASELPGQGLGRATAKVMLAENSLGSLVREVDLDRAYTSKSQKLEEMRGRNWELLRQRAETEGLYFDPVGAAGHRATHALIWVARPDLLANTGRPYDGRFLNIANPWNDERLRRWDGYSELWHFDSQHRRVAPDDPEAKPVEMIPLAIYGLENPRIPALLVDYRNSGNPKRRELSRRVLDDATRNVLGISPFGSVPYFVGRSALSFALNRWGKDVNQPSRLRSLSQLELALALDASVSSGLYKQTRKRVAAVSVNPLDNSAIATEWARRQYTELVTLLQQSEKAESMLCRQREAEARSLLHSRSERSFLTVARVMTFGLYRHREELSAELEEKLAQRRKVEYHLQILRQAVDDAVQTEVVWDLQHLRRSLEVLSQATRPVEKKAASTVAQLLNRTQSEELRLLCLKSLQAIQSGQPLKHNELYQTASAARSVNPPSEGDLQLTQPSDFESPRKPSFRNAGF